MILSQVCESQFIACEHTWAEKYEITAKNGLKLRENQNTESKVIAIIPFKSEIRLCYENTRTETIDGIKGKWVKAFWEDKEGFIFDGYTKQIIEVSKIKVFSTEMDLVNVWKDSGFPQDKELVGLYSTNSPKYFELRKVNLKPEEIPLWVFRGLNVKQTKTIEGTLVNRMLLIGDKQGIETGKFYGTVYGDGKAIKGDSVILGVFKEINPYELRIQSRIKDGEIIDQLLLKMKCWGGLRQFYGYEAGVRVNFIGDLDGDDKDDILVTYQTSYKGWYYGLFSTKYATENKIFKEMTIGSGSE